MFIFSFLLQDAFTVECCCIFVPNITICYPCCILRFSQYGCFSVIFPLFRAVIPRLEHCATGNNDCLYRLFPLAQIFSRAVLPIIQYPLITLDTCLNTSLFSVNRLTPNDPYMGRTAPLTSKRILYIYSTNIGTEYFKRALYSPFFSLQNAVCFIMLTCLVPVLFTFYIQGVLKLK